MENRTVPARTRLTERARKARAKVIAAHQSARTARRAADEAAEVQQAKDRARLEMLEARNAPRSD
ncbi:MAG TPA: hypothetical protein VEO00_03660 [Actinomycetota bacterium]|nr:hypothetical protein [Actinomycetota bacterium]